MPVDAAPREPSSRLRELSDAAVSALLDPAVANTVEMVLRVADGRYEAIAPDGRVRFDRPGDAHTEPDDTTVEGRNPLGDRSTDRFAGLGDELDALHPDRTANAYPYAYDQVAQLFDHAAAPDVCVVHSAGHHWPESGGHVGEHGSLDVVQARAPFVLAGRGTRRRGMSDDSLRLVDVGPTLAALLGVAPRDTSANRSEADALLAGADGVVRHDLLDPADGVPSHVAGFLFDGTNPNVLYDMAASGEAPHVARLIDMGTAMRHGAMAGLPTVTLANHTSILTGRLPGHHGVLHNAWYDRSAARSIDTNSLATWPFAMQHLVDGTETLWEAVRRTWPDAFTAAVDEPCDRGAGFSTFDFFRSGSVPEITSSTDGLPHTTSRFADTSPGYKAWSIIDHQAMDQAVGIWSGRYRDVDYPAPRFMWVNFALTDAAMHEGGPHSEVAAAAIRDTDARLGEVLAAIENADVFDDTAFCLVADHGMEQTSPEVRGDWDAALRDAGIPVRNEGAGFLYLDEV
ncbi:MAG: alkaline phosphatase family protein [Acidimicrobiia bacterium]